MNLEFHIILSGNVFVDSEVYNQEFLGVYSGKNQFSSCKKSSFRENLRRKSKYFDFLRKFCIFAKILMQ